MFRFASQSFLALISLSVALSTSSVAHAAPEKFTIDKAHSSVGFSVRHMMISDVSGSFTDFDGSFTFDDAKGEISDATFTAQTASINTKNEKRDEHLKSADFFDAAKYPTLTLTNSKLKKSGKGKYKWTADLTMHGKTKAVTFDLEHNGTLKEEKDMRAGFTATTTIKRSEWGLVYNKALETGGVAVSDEVKLTLNAEATAPLAEGAAAAPAAPAPKAPKKK